MPESLGSLRAALVLGIIATGTALVGVLILVGGAPRFSSIGFTAAREIAPWYVWGAALLCAGLLAVCGIAMRHPWWCRLGHLLSACVYAFLIVTFIQTALSNATAALTGIGIYGALAVAHVVGAATADVMPISPGR